MFDFPAPATVGQIYEPMPGLVYTYDGAGWSYTAQSGLVLLSISPNVASCGAPALTVTAYGANFTASTVIVWDGAAIATTFVSPTQLTFQVDPTGEALARSVPVTVQDGPVVGVGIAFFNFVAVVVITLTELVPAYGECGVDQPVQVIGGGFLPTTIVSVDAVPVPTTYVSGTELQVTMLGSAQPAPKVVSVTAANGTQQSNALPFNYVLTPVLAAIVPDVIGVSDAPTLVTVSGSNFTAVSKIMEGGVELATTFLSATQLATTVDPAGRGAMTLFWRVRTGTGTPMIASAELPFGYWSNPVINSLTPDTIPIGGPDITVEVRVANQGQRCVVVWDGTDVLTNNPNGAVFTITVQPSLEAAPRVVPVTCRTGHTGHPTDAVRSLPPAANFTFT